MPKITKGGEKSVPVNSCQAALELDQKIMAFSQTHAIKGDHA